MARASNADREGLNKAPAPSGIISHRLHIRASIGIERSGLVIQTTLAFNEWECIGRELASVSTSSAWWLADWLIFGEAAYTGRYKAAIAKSSLDYQTLRNYAWVARRFDLSRRRDSLSFAHHAEVASLEQPEQDYWLRKAEQSGWSRNRLRREVRESQRERRREIESGANRERSGDALSRSSQEAANSKRINVPLTSDQIDLCAKAAASRGMSLHEWAALVLEAAASGPVSRVPASIPA